MKRILTLFLGGLLAVLGISSLPATATPPSLTLDRGHADIFHVTVVDGQLKLDLREDVTALGTQHAPEDVLLKVKPEALMDLPSPYPGAPSAYVLPITQDHNLLWPGWETTEVRQGGFGEVNIVVEAVEGPGEVHVFSNGNFGGIKSVLKSGGTKLPDTIVAPFPAHTHANWVFTAPGAYTFKVHAEATAGGKSFVSNQATYSWQVGDVVAPPSPEPSATATTTSPAPSQSPSASASASASPSVSTSPSTSPSPTQPSTPAPRPSASVTATATATVKPTPKPSPTSSSSTSAAPSPTTEAKITLSEGHADIFHVYPDGSALGLNLREDVTGAQVQHDPSDVLLVARPESLIDIPATLPGAPRAYVLPLTQDPNLLWPGWETTPVGSAGVKRVDLQVRKVTGPGEVHVFSMDSNGKVVSLLDDGGTRLPATIVAPEPAHTHANWVFTKPGSYTMEVQASAVRDGKRVSSPARTYTWLVGAPGDGSGPSAPSQPQAPGAEDPNRPATDQPVNAPGDGDGSAGQPDDLPGTDATPDLQNPAGQPSPKALAAQCFPVQVRSTEAARPGKAADIGTSGHFDLGAQLRDGQLVASLKDDRSSPAKWVSPGSVVMSLQQKQKAPAGMDFIARPGSDVWIIGATQVPGTPWLGQNTMHESIVAGTTGPVTWQLQKVEGPGKLAVFNAGAFGGGVGTRVFDNVGGPTRYTVPANTHAHPNWVFNAPGHYKVHLTMSATTKAGKQVSASTVVHFAVGVDARQVAAGLAAPGSPTVTTRTVGRTKDGKPCTLAGLPGTGAFGPDVATAPAARASGTGADQGAAVGAAVLFALAAAVVATRRKGRQS